MAVRTSLMMTAAACIATAVLSGCGGTAETAGPDVSVGRTAQAQPSASLTPTEHTTTAAAPPKRRTSPKARLDRLIAQNRRQVDSMIKSFKGMYSEIRVEPDYPNGLRFVYVFAKHVDPSDGADYLDGWAPTLQTAFDTQVAPEMEAAGIFRPQATYTYRNTDGSLIWTRTFTMS